jgi:flagellar FliJ protein
MSFHFSLETLLRHRKTLRDEAMRIYAEAQAKVQDKLSEIRQLYNSIDQTRERISSTYSTTTGSLGVIQFMNEFIDGTKVKIGRARFEVRDLMQIAEEKHDRLVEASRNFRMLEKLKEKQKLAWKKEQKRKETKRADDMVMTRLGVKR